MSRKTIAIVRQKIWNPFNVATDSTAILHGVLQYLQDDDDFELVGYGMPLAPHQTLLSIDDLRHSKVKGVLIEGKMAETVAICRKCGIAMVATHRYHEDADVPTVCPDDRAIGRMAAQYFLRLGYQSLAFCGPDYLTIQFETSDPPRMVWHKRRLEGFLEIASKASVACAVFEKPTGRIPQSEKRSIERYMHNLRRWVRGLPLPVGIFGCSDLWAEACLHASQEEGLVVPRDAAVLGVDNDFTRCLACRPWLSSIDRDNERVGYEAAALLCNRLHTGQWAQPAILVPPVKVVERMSTQNLAVADPKLAKALRFVREHFCDFISATDVARAAGTSVSWLRHAFQHELHFSLVSEIRRLRIGKACELLTESDLPLKLIAEATGFRREGYLCYVFAQEMGMSPTAWRNRRRR